MFLVIGFTDNLVVVVDKDDGRLVGFGLLRCHLGIGHDDDLVAHVDTFGCSTVQADDTRPFLACNGIGLEATAVVDVCDFYLLIFQDARLAQQSGVDGDATHVVEVSLLYHSTMNLCLQQSDVHTLLYINDEIVDQSGLANIDGDGNQHLALNLCGALDILEIYHFHVVDTCHRFCLEILLDNLNDNL